MSNPAQSMSHSLTFKEWVHLLHQDPGFNLPPLFLDGLAQHPEWLNATFSDGNFTALMFAAQRGHLKVVQHLIQVGADVHLKNQWGTTALMRAADQGNTRVVNALIEAGSDVNLQNQEGTTALMLACQKGQSAVVFELIQAGADLNVQDQDGCTALMHAADQRLFFIVQKLLKFEGDVNLNLQNQSGWTALMYAALHGDVQILQCLLAAGADQHLRNHDQQTALDLAVNHHQASAVMLLESFFAQKEAEILSQSINPLSLNSAESSSLMRSSEHHDSSTNHDASQPIVKHLRL